jgi:hypothetical protein
MEKVPVLRNKLTNHNDVSIRAEETGGWFVQTSEETALTLSAETKLRFRKVNQKK